MGALSEEQKALLAVSAQTGMAIATFFIAKDVLHDVPALPLVLFRSVAAAVFLLAIARFASGNDAPQWQRGDLWRLAALGILGVPLNQAMFLHGLSLTTAAHAALLYGLTPALVLLLGRLRGTEALTAARVGGIVAAFVGVVLVLAGRPPASDAAAGAIAVRQIAGEHALRGDLWVLGAVVSWALYTAFSRDVVARLGTARATAGALGLGALVFAPLGVPGALALDVRAVPLSAWIAIAWMAVVSSTLAYLAWYYAIRRLAPSRVAVFNNLQPLGSVLVAWALGARPGPSFFLGAALVVCGVLLAQRSRAA